MVPNLTTALTGSQTLVMVYSGAVNVSGFTFTNKPINVQGGAVQAEFGAHRLGDLGVDHVVAVAARSDAIGRIAGQGFGHDKAQRAHGQQHEHHLQQQAGQQAARHHAAQPMRLMR